LSLFLFAQGQCVFEYKNDGVYFIVNWNEGLKEALEAKDVMKVIIRKKISNLDSKAFSDVFAQKDGVAQKIAPYQTEYLIDGEVSITVSEDKMTAQIEFFPPEGGKNITIEEVLKKLDDLKISVGIEEEVLKQWFNEPVYHQKMRIASGIPPQNGENGSVEFHFNTSKLRKPKILEDGRVDYKELNYIESIKKAQVLCTGTPPTKGISGKNIFGIEIKAVDGKMAVFPKGKNVELSSDNMSLLSSIEGCVEYEGGKVNVYQQFDIPKNVDTSTGNVYFVGNVSIQGDVLTGYKVEADGSIFVEGIVEGAILKAGQDIILKKGVSGQGKGMVFAGRNIVAKYIENANVEARENIQAEVIMHSNVKAANKIELLGRKGFLVGGYCAVGNELILNQMGCDMGTFTEIDIGVDPNMKERYVGLKDLIRKREEEIAKLNLMVGTLIKLKQEGRASIEKLEMLKKALVSMTSMKEEVENAKEEFYDLEKRFREEAKGLVKVKGSVYPGVKISIGDPSLLVRDQMGSCMIHRNGVDVTAMPWRP
jgi:uncharacterized protein